MPRATRTFRIFVSSTFEDMADVFRTFAGGAEGLTSSDEERNVGL